MLRPSTTPLKIASAHEEYAGALSPHLEMASNPIPQRARPVSEHIKPYLLPPSRCGQSAKQLYQRLTHAFPDQQHLAESRQFLAEKLALVDPMSSDFPTSMERMEEWLELNNHRVRVLYQRYLTARKQGAPRRFFATKAHALNFIQGVAPTKLVDGSWLYGLVNLWDDVRFADLIRIYLEELGDGDVKLNHVVLYKKLLAELDCEQWPDLPEEYFTQGTIQLALGLNAEQYLPEVIGFNLGYEQLPLHLLISAYELKELGIDPYYFTLHITIDNAATGHARKSLQALFDNMPKGAKAQDFFQRVCNGYKLNQVGMSTNSIISTFELDQEVVKIFKSKSQYGQHAHSDRCRIGGKTINEWLSAPESMPEFIALLIETGWINKNEAPEQSRFWKLIEGDQAKMFGVFSGYEKQVIYDWIAGDSLTRNNSNTNNASSNVTPFPLVNKALAQHQRASQAAFSDIQHYDADVKELESKMSDATSLHDVMQLLKPYLAPAMHHSPAGLMATRLYKSMMFKASVNSHYFDSVYTST